MARKQKQYHFIYKTTNLVNEKYYIGMHSTNDLEDGYIGSGQRLWHSIRKYGRENFQMEILEFFPDRSSLKEREKELVNESLLHDPMCMNLALGGEGGFKGKEAASAGAKGMNSKMWSDSEFRKFHSSRISKLNEKLHKDGVLHPPSWSGKHHTEESRKKIGERNSVSQKGEKNSQFGTCWIHNSNETKKIPRSDIQFYIEKEWKLGRKRECSSVGRATDC